MPSGLAWRADAVPARKVPSYMLTNASRDVRWTLRVLPSSRATATKAGVWRPSELCPILSRPASEFAAIKLGAQGNSGQLLLEACNVGSTSTALRYVVLICKPNWVPTGSGGATSCPALPGARPHRGQAEQARRPAAPAGNPDPIPNTGTSKSNRRWSTTSTSAASVSKSNQQQGWSLWQLVPPWLFARG